MDKKILDSAIKECVEITRKNISIFENKFPNAYSVNHIYEPIENIEWTNGFYTGILWLCYEYTNDEIFKQTALNNVESFEYRIDNRICTDMHDLGFLYTPSCVAGYKLISDERCKNIALKAADVLIERFRQKGKFIQAWGELDAADNYRLIIDCLLNLPLLYWATEVTGNNKYYNVAYAHAKTALNCLIREDGSTYHTYFFDLDTGKPSYGATCQGYKDGSIWSRGQAWGVYGTALSYLNTKDKDFVNGFFRIFDCFIKYLPEDYIPYWDFTFTSGSEPRDSSAAAIAVCGMHEMKKHIDIETKKKQLDFYIENIMTHLIKNYSAKSTENTNGLLYHGTYAKKTEYNTCTEAGVDECVIWGDYFYLEALMRLYKNWNLYW